MLRLVRKIGSHFFARRSLLFTYSASVKEQNPVPEGKDPIIRYVFQIGIPLTANVVVLGHWLCVDR